VLEVLKQHRFDHANSFFSAATGLGSVYLSCFFAALFVPLQPSLFDTTFLPLAVTWIASYGVKLAVDRQKPARSGLAVDVTPSFPSGHAITSVFLAVRFSALLPKAAPVLFTAASAVCLSRVYLAAHYPTDVLVGAGIGAVSAALPWTTPF
jgi:PAP2 superfamily.